MAKVEIEAVNSDEVEPRAELLAVMDTLVSNQATLAETCWDTIYKEIMGEEGYGSGNWWEGDEDAIESINDAGKKLESAADVRDVLGDIIDVTFRVGVPQYSHTDPCCLIEYSPPFEEEHGFVILTDGSNYFSSNFTPLAC